MRKKDSLYETTDVEERNTTLALRDMFASISRCGATGDPLAVVCRSAVRCIPDVQFAYYCYKGEETGHVAAVREGVSFFMPSPDVERQIVAMLRRKARADEVSVLESKTTRPLLPPGDRKRWADFAGFALRVSDGCDSDAAILAFFMSATYTATPRHCVWMGLFADVASSFLSRHRAFGRFRNSPRMPVGVMRGGAVRMKFRDPALDVWVESGLTDARIKALVGVRGSNKSAVLYAIRERVLESGVAENRVVTIDCEDANSRLFKTAEGVMAYLNSYPKTDAVRYLFVDEIGMISQHTELLAMLRNEPGWNVWLASSTEHALQIAGKRHGKECLSVHRLWTNPDELRPRGDLEKYWCQIFMRDIVGGVDHPDIRAKELLAEYYSDHLGEVKSLKDVSKEIGFSGRRISRSSISAYRQTLIDAYLIEVSEIYDNFENEVVTSISGRVFFTDLELRTWRYGSAPDDEATRLALNRLYLELRRKYDKVYTPRDNKADFVTIEPNGKARLWRLPKGRLINPDRFRLNLRGGG